MDQKDLLTQAQTNFDSGNYEKAIQLAKQLMDEDKDNHEAKQIYEDSLQAQWQEKKKNQEEEKKVENQKEDLITKTFKKDILREAIQRVFTQDLTGNSTVAVSASDIQAEKSRLMKDLEETSQDSSPEQEHFDEKVETWVNALQIAPEYEEVRQVIQELQEKYGGEDASQDEIEHVENKLISTLKDIIENVDIVSLLRKLDEMDTQDTQEPQESQDVQDSEEEQEEQSSPTLVSTPDIEPESEEGPLKISHSFQDLTGDSQVLLWEIAGPVDTPAISQLEKTILGNADRGFLYQVIDFEEVKYINSSGMGTLVKLGDMIREKGGEFCLVNVSAKVKELFNMLGLLSVIKIIEPEEIQEVFGGGEGVSPEGEGQTEEGAGSEEERDEMSDKATAGSGEGSTDFEILDGALKMESEALTNCKGVKIKIAGPIDTISITQLDKTVNNAFEAGNDYVVLDFEEVKYINSTGMGTLVKLTDLAPGDLLLYKVSEKVTELFNMMGMLNVLKIIDSLDEVGGDGSAAEAEAEETVEAESEAEETVEAESEAEETTEEPSQPEEFDEVFASGEEKSEEAPQEEKEERTVDAVFEDEGDHFAMVTSQADLDEERTAWIISVRGAVDSDSISRLEKKIDESKEEGHLWQILDFEKVNYINSTGMGLVVKMGDILREAGGDLILINASTKVKELFDMLGLLDVVKFKPSLEKALNEWGADEAVLADMGTQELDEEIDSSGDQEVSDAMALIKEGNALEEEGQLEKAIGRWEEALDQAPEEDREWLSKKIEQSKEKLAVPAVSGDEGSGASEEEAQLVGKSEMNLERELIDLIEQGNSFEKEGQYEKAIESWEEAMSLAHYKGGLQSKIDRLKSKMEEGGGVSAGQTDGGEATSEGDLDDLDKQLAELSEEVSQDVVSNTPVPGEEGGQVSPDDALDDLFGDGGGGGEESAPAAATAGDEDGLDDLFGDGGGGEESAPAAATAGDEGGGDDLDDLFGDGGGGGESAPAAATAGDEGGGDDLDDLFGDGGGGEESAPAAATAGDEGGGDDLDDLFGDGGGEESAPAAATTASAESDDGGIDELFGDEDPAPAGATAASAESDDGGIDELFGDEDPAPAEATAPGASDDSGIDELFGDEDPASAQPATAQKAGGEAEEQIGSFLDEICGDDEEGAGMEGMVTEAIDSSQVDAARDQEVLSLLNQADDLEREGQYQQALSILEKAKEIKDTAAVNQRIERVQGQLQPASSPAGAPGAAPPDSGGEGSPLDIFSDDDFGFGDEEPSGPSSSAPPGVLDFDQFGSQAEDQSKSGMKKLIFLVVFLLILAGGGVVGWMGWQKKGEFNRGLEAYNKGDYDGAIEALKSVKDGGIFVDAEEATSYLNKARVDKYLSEAEKLYEEKKKRLKEKVQKDIGALLKKASKHADEETKGKIKELENKVQISHLEYKVAILRSKGKRKEAAETLNQILRRQKTNQFARKNILALQKEWKQHIGDLRSEKDWNRAIEEAKALAKAFPGEHNYQDLVVRIRQQQQIALIDRMIREDNWSGASKAIEEHLKEYPEDNKVLAFYKRKKKSLQEQLANYAGEKKYNQALVVSNHLIQFIFDNQEEIKTLKERKKILTFKNLIAQGDSALKQAKYPASLSEYDKARTKAPGPNYRAEAENKIHTAVERSVEEIFKFQKEKKYDDALTLLRYVYNYADDVTKKALKSRKSELLYSKLIYDAQKAEAKGNWDLATKYYEQAKDYADSTAKKEKIQGEINSLAQKKKDRLEFNKIFNQAKEAFKSDRFKDSIKWAEKAKKFTKLFPALERQRVDLIKAAQKQLYGQQIRLFNRKIVDAKKNLKSDKTNLAYKQINEALKLCPKNRPQLKNQALKLRQKAQRVKDMVYVPAGPFFMGTNDKNAEPRETPQHRVYVKAFYIDRHEVTNSQYAEFLNYIKRTGDHSLCHPKEKRRWKNGKDHTPKFWKKSKWNKSNYPVVGVDWYDAYAYAKWKNKRLPSEQEWEKAASWNPKKNSKNKYPWGDKWDKTKLHHWKNGARRTARVMSYFQGKSYYGCFDMAGNVWEWVSNWCQPYPGCGHSDYTFGTSHKIVRGGSWADYEADRNIPREAARFAEPHLSTTTYRKPLKPKIRSTKVGFRCVRNDFEK